MKDFFYLKGSEKIGPMSFSELQAAGIAENTLVWFEGLNAWQPANCLRDLDPLFTTEKASLAEEVVPERKSDNTVSNAISAEVEEDYTSKVTAFGEPAVFEIEAAKGWEDPFGGSPQRKAMFAAPFSFKGRIRRTEYWISCFIHYLIYIICQIALVRSDDGSAIFFVLLICTSIYFFVAQSVKRCHDRGNSGWYILIPLYQLWLAFGEGDVLHNEYGPNPKW